MLKHYVEYLLCWGGTIIDGKIEEISERHVSKIDISNYRDCIGFRFFDRTEVIIEGELLTGERKNISGPYIKGKLITLEQIKSKHKKSNKDVITLMEENNIATAVMIKDGFIIPCIDTVTIL